MSYLLINTLITPMIIIHKIMTPWYSDVSIINDPNVYNCLKRGGYSGCTVPVANKLVGYDVETCDGYSSKLLPVNQLARAFSGVSV